MQDTPAANAPQASEPSQPRGASHGPSLLAAVVRPGPWLRVGAGALGIVLVVTMFWLGSKPGASNFIPTPPWDRLLHFVVYGGYATLGWIASGGRWLPGVLAAVVIGLADEGLQSLAPGRTADWTDIAADIAGALVAVWVMGALRRRFGRGASHDDGRDRRG